MADKIVVITGPTATGKTRLSVELAKKFGGEIVSADSMQIYRGMDIGTAKVTHTEMQGVAHHMIDIVDPTEVYSVSRYVEDANKAVQDILARGRLPIIAGGTNLYIDSLISGLDFAERAEDNALRERLNAQYDELGGEAMIETLRGFDPERAAKLHPADKAPHRARDRDIHSHRRDDHRARRENRKAPEKVRRGEDSPELCRPRHAVRQDKRARR